MGLGLLIAAGANALFTMVRDLAVLRLSGRMDAVIQAAVIDRMLELPTTFFRQYTAGDLASRALGIDAIRQVLSQSFLSVILSSVFSIVSFAQLFTFDMRLALSRTGLVLILIVVMIVSTLIQVRQQRVIADAGRAPLWRRTAALERRVQAPRGRRGGARVCLLGGPLRGATADTRTRRGRSATSSAHSTRRTLSSPRW